MAKLRVIPEVTIQAGKKVTGYIFGFPWFTTDLITKNLVYSRVLDTDVDNMTPLDTTLNFNSSNVYIPIQPDFTERKYNYKFFTGADITASIGGIGGFLKPIFGWLVQLFIISFLYQLS